jgi:ribonuclease T2
MRRGDAAVFSISVALAAVVAGAVALSVYVDDRPRNPSGPVPDQSTASLLVVTWGPSLCKVDPSNAGCTSGHVGKLGPTLIMHGLWPQPPTQQFCAKPDDPGNPWDQQNTTMSSLDLPRNVAADLDSMMSDAEIMAPHEWRAHGSCSGVPPASYFGIATELTEQVNKILDPVFEKSQGGHVSLSALRDRFATEFGADAGKRVSLNCREVAGEGVVAYEVHVSLPPVTDLRQQANAPALKDVITKGPEIAAGCRRASVP